MKLNFQSDMKFVTLKTQNMQNLKVFYYCIAFFLTETTPVVSNDGIQIGPNVRLPPNYDVQVLPSIPVRVNISVVLIDIISVDEPKQVEFKTIPSLRRKCLLKTLKYFPFQLLHLLLGFRMKWFDHRVIVGEEF